MSAYRIGVVGAGPAGIMGALEAAQRGARVLLFDTNAMVGRKLLVTGNGRCNISNQQAAAERYVCADPDFLRVALGLCGNRETLSRLHELGIPTHATADGWCYPLSDSAATVAETLAAALDLTGVEMHLKTKISDLCPRREGLSLAAGGPEHTYAVDRVIVATGGKASPALGARGAFLPVLQRLGHAVVPVCPALVPLIADMRQLHKLQGVRLDVGLTLLERGQVLGRSVGNLLFTQQGLSGPAAMDLSHLVSVRAGAPLDLVIDLVPAAMGALRELLGRNFALEFVHAAPVVFAQSRE